MAFLQRWKWPCCKAVYFFVAKQAMAFSQSRPWIAHKAGHGLIIKQNMAFSQRMLLLSLKPSRGLRFGLDEKKRKLPVIPAKRTSSGSTHAWVLCTVLGVWNLRKALQVPKSTW
jgi:hypothetical protein